VSRQTLKDYRHYLPSSAPAWEKMEPTVERIVLNLIRIRLVGDLTFDVLSNCIDPTAGKPLAVNVVFRNCSRALSLWNVFSHVQNGRM
jgi:hypothetical protein